MPRIVVIGAGVVGLTSALQLARESQENHITVVAKHMPGDYDIQYTSPWAGANFLPMSTQENSRWERRTWPELERLAAEVPEAGVHFQKAIVYRNAKDLEPSYKNKSNLSEALFDKNPWYSTISPSFRRLPASELPPNMAYGHEFTSVCINSPVYLSWLVGQCSKLRVVFQRGVVSHITAVRTHAGAKPDIVVNATGLGARKLGGVEDDTVYPTRGQVVVVSNVSPAMLCVSSTEDGEEEIIYTMTRAVGGGTILGGTYQKNNWDPNPDPNIANRIMSRVAKMFPDIAGGKGVAGLDVIRHGVGLRPSREGGVRLEKEKVGDVWVVHNYGHSSWGYQGSYGSAERVVELVAEIGRNEVGSATAKSRL